MNIDIFCVRCPDLDDACEQGAALLTPGRRLKMERYLQREDQLRCLGGGLLLRRVLGVTADTHLAYGSMGKPLLAKPGAPGFSLAHAGKYATLAVGAPVLGTDIEPFTAARLLASEDADPGQNNTDKPFMSRVMTPEEQHHWAAASRQDAFFLKLWTGKESIMKATGHGLSLDPASFSILPLQDAPRLWRGHEWFLAWRELEAHQLAVASPFPFSHVQIKVLSAAELLY